MGPINPLDPSFIIVVGFIWANVVRMVAGGDLFGSEIWDPLDEKYGLYKLEDTAMVQSWVESYGMFFCGREGMGIIKINVIEVHN